MSPADVKRMSRVDYAAHKRVMDAHLASMRDQAEEMERRARQ